MNKNNTVEKKIGESLQLQHISCLNKENNNSQSGESEIKITTFGVFRIILPQVDNYLYRGLFKSQRY